MGESGSLPNLNVAQVQAILLRQLGLRVGPEVAAYVLRRWQTSMTPAAEAASTGFIPVMGGDARTGVPVRRDLDPSVLPYP